MKSAPIPKSQAGLPEVFPGDRVAYEDMANPRREGIINAMLTTRWGTEFEVCWDDGGGAVSDLRQNGWKLVDISATAN